MKKKVLCMMMASMLALGSLVGCSQPNTQQKEQKAEAGSVEGKAPKYVFLFIGDGMSYPQIQLTNYFVSANESKKAGEKVTVEGEEKEVLQSKKNLAMMDFPIAGSAQTYDSTSFAPDSASTATSIATGEKTWSGSINVSLDFSEQYETIAEKLKEQKEYKIGVVSSVNINHATPAAFYAHQPSRNSYYEIGQEMIDSKFDYFAGARITKSYRQRRRSKRLIRISGRSRISSSEDAERSRKINSRRWKSNRYR